MGLILCCPFMAIAVLVAHLQQMLVKSQLKHSFLICKGNGIFPTFSGKKDQYTVQVLKRFVRISVNKYNAYNGLGGICVI